MAEPAIHLTEAVEDYLKAIYKLTRTGDPAQTAGIAREIGVKAGSVTGMIQRLAASQLPLVSYKKHHGVTLTEVGQEEALRVLRRHRLLELFLTDKLGYGWDEVHAEAEELEHAASDRFIDQIAKLLGDPSFDPHGDPIPDRDLNMPESPAIPLDDVSEGVKVIVRRIITDNSELFSYLGSLGIVPGCEITVTDRVPLAETCRVRITGGEEFHFGMAISANILVEEVE